jgi:Protein of unknown function (DUF1569)
MDGRRELGFERLDEVMTDVEPLLSGHTLGGRWSLGQILHHLASAIRLTIRSDEPSTPAPLDADRSRVFEVRRRRFFGQGRFPEGGEIPHPSLVPPQGADEQVEAESLRFAIREFEAFEGPFPAHPVLGPLSKAEWDHFHRIHSAHHLSFARAASTVPVPISSDTGGEQP